MNRDLDGCERFYWIANQWSPNNVVAVCELDGELELTVLSRAVSLLCDRHPILRHVVLADASGRQPRFVRQRAPSPAPIRTEVADQSAWSGAHSALETELNSFLDPARQLFRVTYVAASGKSALLVTLLHIVADATAAMNALRDLLRFYALAKRTASPTVTPLPARPSYVDLLPPMLRAPRNLPRVVNAHVRAGVEQLRARPSRLPAEQQNAIEPPRNRLHRRSFTAAELSTLKTACHQQEVSVHGLLTAAFAISIADEMGLRDGAHTMLNVGSPVSFRDRLEPAPRDELGSYVATLPVALDVARAQSLFSVARQVNRELSRRKQRDEELAMMQLAQWIAPPSHSGSERFVEMAELRGPGNVCISNIGSVDFPSEVVGIPIRHAHWAASLSITGYLLCAVCSTNDGLELDLTYVEGKVSPTRAERIAQGMARVLSSVIKMEATS